MNHSNLDDPATDASARWYRYFFIVAVMISFTLGVLRARNDPPRSDEGRLSSPAYNLAHSGFFGTTVMESQGTGLTRIEQQTYWTMPLYPLAEAGWYTLASSTIFSTRALSLFVWYPIGLASFCVFLARLDLGRGVAPLAAGLLAVSPTFIESAAAARPNMMCFALGLAGIAVYLTWRETHFYLALFASNILIAASILTHPSGILYLLGSLIIALWFDRSRIGWRAIAASLLPYVTAGVSWGLYIACDVRAFGHQILSTITNGRWDDFLDPAAILKGEIVRHFTGFGVVMPSRRYLLAVYLTAVAGCLLSRTLRGRANVRLLLTLLGCCFAAMLVFRQELINVNSVPLCVAILAVWIGWIWQNRPRLKGVIVVTVGALVVIETSSVLMEAATRPYEVPERAAVAFVLEQAKPNDRICGSAALNYSLGFDSRLRDDPYLGVNSGRVPDVVIVENGYRSLYAAWTRERPSDMQRIRDRLGIYRLAYREGDYEVYLLPEISSAFVPAEARSRSRRR